MKKFILSVLIISTVLILCSCSSSNSDISALQSQVKQLQDENQKLKDTIASQQSAPTISPTTTSSPTPVAEPTGNETIQLNSPVTIADICEFKVTKARFTDKVNPPNPDSYYSYYEVKDKNNTYLDIVISYKNLEGSEKSADSAANVDVTYNGKYNYTSFPVIEESGGGDFSYANITSIDPLKTGVLHFLCEVPKELKTSTNQVIATISVNGNKYDLNVK